MMINVGRWDLWKGFRRLHDAGELHLQRRRAARPWGLGGEQTLFASKRWPRDSPRDSSETSAYVDAGRKLRHPGVSARRSPSGLLHLCLRQAGQLSSGRGTCPPIATWRERLYRCRMQQACGPLLETRASITATTPGDGGGQHHGSGRRASTWPHRRGAAELADLFSNRRLSLRGQKFVWRFRRRPAGCIFLPGRRSTAICARHAALQTAMDHAALCGAPRFASCRRGCRVGTTAIAATLGPDAARPGSALSQLAGQARLPDGQSRRSACRRAGPRAGRSAAAGHVQPARPRLSCQIQRKQVSLTSGDHGLGVGPAGTIDLAQRPRPNCGLSIRELHAAQAGSGPTTSTPPGSARRPDCKEVESGFTLCGEKSQPALPDVRLMLVVRSGVANRASRCKARGP